MRHATTLLLGICCLMHSLTARAELIARDDFDSPIALIEFQQQPPAGSFRSRSDALDSYRVGVSEFIPGVLLDESLRREDDARGIVDTSTKQDRWFGVSDTRNDDNPEGTFQLQWLFAINGATQLEVSVDMAAWGDFENSDHFDWAYRLDEGPLQPLFTSSIETGASHLYEMASGKTVELKDPLSIDQRLVDNQWQTFTRTLEETGQYLTIQLQGLADGGEEAYVFDNLQIHGEPADRAGDLNDDGLLDAQDLDLLSWAVRTGNGELRFDLNEDGSVDHQDRFFWIEVLQTTWLGDANLDGEFNSSDLVGVFQTGQYEDTQRGNSSWTSGDWNGDGDFDSSDFVAAFQGGGFEQGPRTAEIVPEPSATRLVLVALLSVAIRRKAAPAKRPLIQLKSHETGISRHVYALPRSKRPRKAIHVSYLPCERQANR